MPRLRASNLLVLTLIIAGTSACDREEKPPKIKWDLPETFFIVDKSERETAGVRLEFHFLIDAPADKVYRALTDVENYDQFVPGVQETELLSHENNVKTIHIAQTVIGQQTRAKVAWTLDPPNRRMSFTTLHSDGSYNDGSYWVISDRSGKRCYVISRFLVKQRGLANAMPIGLLANSVRESIGVAARAIKTRALTLR